MALIKASYTVGRAKAYAGQIADTSLYNIDGTNVATADITVGTLIAVQSLDSAQDGHRLVAKAADNSKPLLGIAVMSHYESPEGKYYAGDCVNVMTHGRVWALAEKAITEAQAGFNLPVTFNASGFVAASGGAITSNYTFTGEVLDTDNTNFKLVKIQLTQGAVPQVASAAASE